LGRSGHETSLGSGFGSNRTGVGMAKRPRTKNQLSDSIKQLVLPNAEDGNTVAECPRSPASSPGEPGIQLRAIGRCRWRTHASCGSPSNTSTRPC
jgi:hypothetical protein